MRCLKFRIGRVHRTIPSEELEDCSVRKQILNIAELKYSTNELELLGLVWTLDHFKNYLSSKQFSILTDHKALIGALKDDKYTKTAQSRLTRWADKLLPSDFTVNYLPGKDMGFVDYIPRLPSGEPVPVSLDDEKFVIALVNQISTFLGFEHSQILRTFLST